MQIASDSFTFIILLSTVPALPERRHHMSHETRNTAVSTLAQTPEISAPNGRNAFLTSSASILGGASLIGASVAASFLQNKPATAGKTRGESFSLEIPNDDSAIHSDSASQVPRTIWSDESNREHG